MSGESQDQDETRAEFEQLVNMAPAELEQWLATDESKDVGWGKEGGGESVGHESGRRIVKLRRTKVADLSSNDYADMRKVIGYIKRHTAQPPNREDQGGSHWRYSLMKRSPPVRTRCKTGPGSSRASCRVEPRR